jgi:hypothetical protein
MTSWSANGPSGMHSETRVRKKRSVKSGPYAYFVSRHTCCRFGIGSYPVDQIHVVYCDCGVGVRFSWAHISMTLAHMF